MKDLERTQKEGAFLLYSNSWGKEETIEGRKLRSKESGQRTCELGHDVIVFDRTRTYESNAGPSALSEIHSRNFLRRRKKGNIEKEGGGRRQWIGIEGKEKGMVKYFLRVPHEYEGEESERFFQMHSRSKIKGRR